MMKIVIPKEVAENEARVAATPETVKKFVSAGCSVTVQAGAGENSDIRDSDYEAAGAKIEPDAAPLFDQADVVFGVQKPEAELLKEGTLVIAFLAPFVDLEGIADLARRKITALAMEAIPRIARAQKLDALSSQANVAGYKAVLMAAGALRKMMPMMMTAAGTVSPAKVFVIGAGVAGLQAIATAKRLGAVVEAFDTRPAVKEQVESLGGKFLSLNLGQAETEDKGGYAKELSQEAHRKEQELIAQAVQAADIVITTAQIPGKPAPRLITKEMVQRMKQGSVIVDLAAEGGGNCELTEAGKETVQHEVTIIGQTNLPSLVAAQSSQLYARNVAHLFFEIYKDGKINLDPENEIVRGALITHQGAVAHATVKELIQQKGISV